VDVRILKSSEDEVQHEQQHNFAKVTSSYISFQHPCLYSTGF